MYLCTLAFLAGVMSLTWLSAIPNLICFLPALSITALLWRFTNQYYCRFFQYLLVALLGCWFICIRSEQLLHWQLPKELEAKTVTVTGVIANLPAVRENEAQFEFMLKSIDAQPQHARLRLTWYHYEGAPLMAGDLWQLQVRLKRPHGLLNPGGFDYEAWLFAHGIRATGYVIHPTEAKRLTVRPWIHPIDHMRSCLQQKIRRALAGQPTAGLISALILGAQDDISQDQWRVMRATGTNHLMAIAGVHIAFVAHFIYLLSNFLWRKSARLPLYFPAPQAAACAALAAAIIYSALAGFALPTQRALIMLSVFMVGVLARRSLNTWNALVLALLLVLLWDPFAPLSISFWLSFIAVFAIVFGTSGRLKPSGLWWKFGRIQWVITIALIPVSLELFQQSSIISLLANLLAVPAVGILVLPLCLVGALLTFAFPWAGHWVLWLAAKLIALIWDGLAILANLPGAVWQQTMPNIWILVAAGMGALLFIAPRGFPGRWLGTYWLLPLIFYRPAAPGPGEVRFSLLDVGQGLSAVIQTQHHALVFDTGPPMGKKEDAAGRAILPFLKKQGINQLDILVISHGDSDHIGGATTLLKNMSVRRILTSVPEKFPQQSALETCQRGQRWQWDGVVFRVLYPPAELLHQGNNSSCVLRVETPAGALLLTGDIEKSAETYLLTHTPLDLAAKILVVPHHGSSTSSSVGFVQAVHPAYALLPVGYQNSYHFPRPEIVARYQQLRTYLFDTASSGALIIEIADSHIHIQAQRQLNKKIWYDSQQ